MLHTLQTTNKNKKRVGRGGARGKNSGHGHKGQRSRAGHKIRPAIRDEIQRIPKRRGHNKNRARNVREDKLVRTITLTMLEKNFKKGEIVTPAILTEKKIISNFRGVAPKVKIVCTGEISSPLVIKRCACTDTAKERIEKAGGSIEKTIINKVVKNKGGSSKAFAKYERDIDTENKDMKDRTAKDNDVKEKEVKDKTAKGKDIKDEGAKDKDVKSKEKDMEDVNSKERIKVSK